MNLKKTILYVDDDADDREFLSEAMKIANPEIRMVFAEDGIKAMHYLNELRSSNSNLPCLIILDINMPFLDGRQTLERIKKDPGFQNLPVVIFSSSENPNDKIFFNNSGIEMITKPGNISYLNAIANRLLHSCA